jgi:hypothetical protein
MSRLPLIATLTAILVSSALAGAGMADAQTVIVGRVASPAGQPLAGLALFEKGPLHSDRWHRGTLVDADGRFRIELAEGGQYGLHVYASGHIYSPNPVYVRTGQPKEVDVVLKPEPTRANDPVIRRVGFFPWEARQGAVTFVKLDVFDPNGDLSPQVLAFNARTGRVYAMQPPHPVRDPKANFPDGVYQVEIDTAAGPIEPRDWHFVVADHYCNTSDVLRFPHEPAAPGVVAK